MLMTYNQIVQWTNRGYAQNGREEQERQILTEIHEDWYTNIINDLSKNSPWPEVKEMAKEFVGHDLNNLSSSDIYKLYIILVAANELVGPSHLEDWPPD